jgi:hypothetical protein
MKYLLLKNKLTGIRSVYNRETKEKVLETDNPELYKELRKKALLNANRNAKNEAMRSLGLVSYRNQSGTVCWE